MFSLIGIKWKSWSTQKYDFSPVRIFMCPFKSEPDEDADLLIWAEMFLSTGIFMSQMTYNLKK